ncbi:MAG: hypothetical protein IE926_02600, partial [Micrococcales bacterium]|nr:hypothetical protein [Micrococcales bacterium]
MPDDQRARTAREALVLAAVLLAAVVVFDRGQPVPQPEKTVTGALLLVLAGLAWALCRCIGLRWWAGGAAVLLVAVCPPFLLVMRDGFGSPATVVGVIAALVALLLLVRPRPGRPALLVGAGAVVVAVVLAPPTLWCLSGPVLALWRSARSRASEAQDTTVVWVAVGAHALLAFGLVVGWGRFGAASSTGTDDVGAVAALVSGLAVAGGLVLRRVRPLALSSLTTLTAVLVPGRAPESLVLLAVIVTCVVVAAVADGFVRYRPTRLAGRDVRRLVPALAVAAAVTVGALVLPGWAPRVLPAAVPGSGQVAEGRSGPATSPPSPATD